MHLCTMYRKRFGRQKGKNTFIFHQNDLMDQCSIDRIPHLTMALVKCRVIFKGMEQEKLFLIYNHPANWMKNIKSRKIQIKVETSKQVRFFWIFVFTWNSHSWSSAFEIQKGRNSKIIFPIPYPIIYIPG